MEPKDSTYNSEQKEKEPYKRAIDFLFKTLQEEPTQLKEFESKLIENIEALPQYQGLKEAVIAMDLEDVPKAVFELLKKGSDEVYDQTEGNGVLIDSMKTGKLECAGRTMIASRLFTNKGVEHAIATPYGHSMIIFEQDGDTLVYFDANNDLFFSFPKSALRGYEGLDKMTETYLEDYTQREKDFYEGRNSVMRRMMVLPPRAGILNSYLNNAGAALGGAPEFEADFITIDQEASESIQKLKQELLGEQNVPEKFYQDGQKEQAILEEEKQELSQIIRNHFSESEEVDGFIEKILPMGALWRRWPYLQAEQDKKKLLADWYNRLSNEE